MSNTPETDAQLTTFTSISKLKKHFVNRTGAVSAEFARQLERERDKAGAECLKQCELLAVSGDREEKLRGEILKYREATSELIRLLEIEEESDSGTSFKPNRINSCRIMDAMQINQCLQTLKRLSQ